MTITRWLVWLVVLVPLMVACEDGSAQTSPSGPGDLTRIVAARCQEDASQVEKMVRSAVDFIERDFGKRVTVNEVLRELLAATAGKQRVDCAERLAWLIVFIGRQRP